MRSTWLTELLEAGLKGESLSVYLHRKSNIGWTQTQMQEDLEHRTGIHVSQATLSNWTNGMGYAKRQAAKVAWKEKLIPESPLEQRNGSFPVFREDDRPRRTTRRRK